MFILPKNAIDLTGKQFDFWTAIEAVGKTAYGSIVWRCQCKCGFVKDIDGQSLRKGTSRSCRCKKLGENLARGETHKGTGSVEWVAYHGAKGRCNNPNNGKYPQYGGRGIEFRFESFEEFLAELGRKPSPQHSLNRIDNNGHYEKGNVEWATATDQVRNRRNSVEITVDGVSKTIVDWASETGLKFETIVSRIYMYGWCHKCSVTFPVVEGKRQCFHNR